MNKIDKWLDNSIVRNGLTTLMGSQRKIELSSSIPDDYIASAFVGDELFAIGEGEDHAAALAALAEKL